MKFLLYIILSPFYLAKFIIFLAVAALIIVFGGFFSVLIGEGVEDVENMLSNTWDSFFS